MDLPVLCFEMGRGPRVGGFESAASMLGECTPLSTTVWCSISAVAQRAGH